MGGCSCYGFSHEGKQACLQDVTAEMTSVREAVVYAVCVSENGSASKFDFIAQYEKNLVSVSPYEMTTASLCRKVCHEHEALWNICVPQFSHGRTPSVISPQCNEHDPLLNEAL